MIVRGGKRQRHMRNAMRGSKVVDGNQTATAIRDGTVNKLTGVASRKAMATQSP
jgi:hypothetical protein